MPSPIVSATFQAASLSTVSNICAQLIDAYQKSAPFAFDLAQLLRFVALAFLTAPPNYHWQQFLERSFPAYLNADGTAGTGRAGDAGRAKDDVEMKAGVANDIVGVGSGDSSEQRGDAAGRGRFSLRNTLTKWFIDCITMGAIMNTVAFLVLMGVMKGQGWTQISSNIRTVCALPLTFNGAISSTDWFCRRQSRLLWLGTRSGRLRPSSASPSSLSTAALYS
jgi:hypothetical protein